MRKLFFIFALLSVSMMGWATQYCGEAVQSTVDNTSVSISATVKRSGDKTLLVQFESSLIASMRDGGCFQGWGDGAVWENQEDAVQNFEVGWTQTGNVWSKEFTFSTYPVSGTGQIYALFNLTEGSPAVAGFTLSTVDLFTDCSSGDPEPPAVTGICATSTYTSNVAGYDIHAQVTKGVNKYYLTLTSATDGKTLTGLVGDNMYCHQYSEEARSHAHNYHMAAAGHYAISEGAITFTIPSVGDPDMYTPINVRFSDNTACEITGLNGVRLVPCSTEDPVPYDPDPSVINDVNFASISNGAVAYASDGNPWEAIDNNNGTRWGTAASDPQWFIVDLGQRRIFNTIQIRWEGAYGKTFTIDVSNDASSWTTVKSVTNQELEGFPYEQQFDIDQTTARYVRFYGTARGTGYGYSFWEFRVIKATTPVLTTYTASLPSPFCPLGSNYQVTVTAKDQIGNDFPVENTFSVSPVGAGTITSTGVYTPSVVGVATITAEGGGMSSSVTVHNEVSANLALNQPATAGHDNANAFRSNNADTGDRWGSSGGTHPTDDWWYVDLGAKYDISEIAIKWETARPNDYDIRVSDDASSWINIGTFNSYPAANEYEYYNSLSAVPGRYVGVLARAGYESLAYGISMYDFEVFGTENVSSNKYVSATASPAAGGSVSVQAAGVDVTEVPSGTEVTFTATPNDGYIFVNWTRGGVEVATSSSYTATITANTALVANFRALGTIYCNTILHSNNGGQEHDAYVTMKRSGENEYQLIVRTTEALRNFGGTNFYKPNNVHVIDIRDQGVLSNNNHTLTVTFNADKEPYMTDPLYVVLQGGFEAQFPQLTNIEYSQPCADPEITAITLDKTEATLEMGNTLTLVPTFTPAYMSADITWQTSDADVASVEDGVVTANAIGTATITAETSNGKTATCAVTVEPITEKTWWGTQTITDWDPDMDVMWSVTRNANKTLTYTVYFGGDASGKVKQINNGEWHGLVGYDDVNRVASYTTETTYETGTKIKPDHFFYFGGPRIELADVYVVGSENERPSTAVESVEISSTAASLLPEENLQLTATVLPSFVENKNVNWSSDNKSVATVTNTGYVTAVADGTAHITATSVADGTKSATCTITVVSSITAATWYGYSTVSPLEGLTAYTYSITRGTDHKLTFTMTTDKNVVGYVSGIEGDVTGVFGGYDAVNHTGTFTTAGTYTDGAELHLRLTFASASYGAPAYNFSYTVGSSNAALPQAVAVDETKDNSGILTTYDGETVVGVLGRSFVADNLYTLVVPFNVDAAQTAAKLPGQLTKLNNSYEKANGDLRINFVDASAIEAGVPYLYQPSANVTNPAFVGVSVSKDLNPTEPADGLAKYYGIYAPMDGDALHAKTNAYVLGPDQYLYAVSDLPDNQTMAALRAYFVLNFPSAGPGAPKRLAKVVFNSNETETTTDVTEVQTGNECIKVIVNGQLQIIRDGKTYNAFGQLVK